MAGILDNKARVMDVIVTKEGKRQIGTGDFKISYASFTDKNAFYDKSSISGSFDSAINRPYLEATSLAFDQITIEKDDNGAVIPFATIVSDVDQARINIKGGTIIKDGEPQNNKDPKKMNTYADAIIASTLGNFKKQMIIASRDPIDDSETFDLSINDLRFNYGNRGPIVGDDIIVSLDQAASVFTDKIFSNTANFMFLPPVAKTESKTIILGQYQDIRNVEKYDYDDLMNDLVGSVPDQPVCPNQEIVFTNTSVSNDICIQAFEINKNFNKLEMVDFGDHNSARDPTLSKRVVFLGKTYVDHFGATNFANIFTLILE